MTWGTIRMIWLAGMPLAFVWYAWIDFEPDTNWQDARVVNATTWAALIIAAVWPVFGGFVLAKCLVLVIWQHRKRKHEEKVLWDE